MNFEKTLDEIDWTPVDEVELKTYSTERQHYGIAFNLFRETAGCVCILASTTVGQKSTWGVSQAVLGGHVVRMFKLMRFVMEESINGREELLSILVRLLAECVINLRYLITNHSDELVNSYLAHSLRHEKDLAQVIREKVNDRGGVELPIETRMLRSIQGTFEKSQFTENSLSTKKIKNWGGKNLFEKAQQVDMGDAYLAIFGGPSRNVHGGWQDLLQFHLESTSPGEFIANLKFKNPRPQAVYTLSHLVALTMLGYVNYLAHPAIEVIGQRLHTIVDRNRIANNLHEDYLIARMDK